MPQFLDNPFFVGGIIAAFFGFIVIMFIIKNKSKTDYKKFIPRPFSDTINDEMKDKFKLVGIDFKGGKLHMGVNKIGDIRKYFYAKGKFSDAIFDEKSKKFFIDEKDDIEYNLLFIKCKSHNILFRLLKIKNIYYILRTKDKDEKDIIQVDHLNKRIFLPVNTDLISYGGVWHNSLQSVEYVNDISVKKMLQEVMTHLESTPDKVAHMEQEQAKLERTARVYADYERFKWEDKKKSGDTTIM